MASNPESHADICSNCRAIWQGCENVTLSEYDGKDLLNLIDRLEAAHKREIDKLKNRPTAVDDDLLKMARDIDALRAANAKLRETLRQAIVEYCHDCDHCNYADGAYDCDAKQGECFVQEWRKVLEETK